MHWYVLNNFNLNIRDRQIKDMHWYNKQFANDKLKHSNITLKFQLLQVSSFLQSKLKIEICL